MIPETVTPKMPSHLYILNSRKNSTNSSKLGEEQKGKKKKIHELFTREHMLPPILFFAHMICQTFFFDIWNPKGK